LIKNFSVTETFFCFLGQRTGYLLSNGKWKTNLSF
jgi:hypothetical protein